MQEPDADASSEFRILETVEFSRRLALLPHRDSGLIRRKLDKQAYPQLRRQPFRGPHVKKLHGFSQPTWRYRMGNYRVFYTVAEDERRVSIVSIELRRDAYR